MPVSPEHLSVETAQAWAKRIQKSMKSQGHPVPLHVCQTALAQAMGCTQWAALTAHLGKRSPATEATLQPIPEKSWAETKKMMLSEQLAPNQTVADFFDALVKEARQQKATDMLRFSILNPSFKSLSKLGFNFSCRRLIENGLSKPGFTLVASLPGGGKSETRRAIYGDPQASPLLKTVDTMISEGQEIRLPEDLDALMGVRACDHAVATIEATSALGIVERLMDIQGDQTNHYTRAILRTQMLIYQRLLPRLCQHCATPYRPGDFNRHNAWIDESWTGMRMRGPGCDHCKHGEAGIDGRELLTEVIAVTDPLREMLYAQDFSGALHWCQDQWGAPTIVAQAQELVEAGKVSVLDAHTVPGFLQTRQSANPKAGTRRLAPYTD